LLESKQVHVHLKDLPPCGADQPQDLGDVVCGEAPSLGFVDPHPGQSLSAVAAAQPIAVRPRRLSRQPVSSSAARPVSPIPLLNAAYSLRDPARRFFQRARAGDFDICTSTEVLQEILYRYSALKRLDLAGSVYDLFVQLCPTVLPVALADTDRANALLTAASGISVRDAVHAAVMLNHGLTEIATFDGAFDRIDGLTRLALP
jgi:predicted nucleic acid-binding protein